MTYHLSYRDFQAFLERRNRALPNDRPLGITAEGHSQAATYIWKRFVRCWGNPPLADVLYPKPNTCEPMEFTDEDHWKAVYQSLVKKRSTTVRRRETNQHTVTIGTLTSHADDKDPVTFDIADSRAGSLENTIILHDEMRTRVETEFDVNVPDGPEIRDEMLNAIEALRRGAAGTFKELVNDGLQNRLPDRMGPDEAPRQRRSRAVKRACDFVKGMNPST